MLILKKLIIQGWPKDFKECPLLVRSYWNFRDELLIVDGVVVKGTCIVIPTKLCPELLSLLHDDSHLGTDKCIQRAKGSVYWPNISDDIKAIVNKCEKCLANCCRNQKEPFIPFEIPIIAWKTVSKDLFKFQDQTYMVVVDLFSHFPVVRQLHGETTKLILNAFKGLFSDFGIPKVIISDNGPCYKSEEFHSFCAKFDIVHQTGASYNHLANSITEHAIQTIKHLMVKN